MKTFNEYIAETTAPIIMDVVRMQKYEKRIRSARIEKRKRTMRSDKSISIVKNTLKKRGYYSEKTKGAFYQQRCRKVFRGGVIGGHYELRDCDDGSKNHCHCASYRTRGL